MNPAIGRQNPVALHSASEILWEETIPRMLSEPQTGTVHLPSVQGRIRRSSALLSPSPLPQEEPDGRLQNFPDRQGPFLGTSHTGVNASSTRLHQTAKGAERHRQPPWRFTPGPEHSDMAMPSNSPQAGGRGQEGAGQEVLHGIQANTDDALLPTGPRYLLGSGHA